MSECSAPNDVCASFKNCPYCKIVELEKENQHLSKQLDDEVEECAGLQWRIAKLEAKWALVFDGNAVYKHLTEQEKHHVSPEALSAVLDALNRASKALEGDK